MKILIMGLPGSGKTYLSERLQVQLECAWFNADKVRFMANDWGFGDISRINQARRMRNIADYEKSLGRTVICDFVCPTSLTRDIFEADVTIWMNTIKEGRFEDTNKLFEPPKPNDFDYEINEFLSNVQIVIFAEILRGNHGL